MANTYKILGQGVSQAVANNSTTSEVTVYQVPANTQAAISRINIANTTSSSQTYRLSFVPSSETTGTSYYRHYSIYDATIAPKSTYEIKGGITLGAGDQIRAYSSTSNQLSINVYGVEIL
jgi:hypothetical protein